MKVDLEFIQRIKTGNTQNTFQDSVSKKYNDYREWYDMPIRDDNPEFAEIARKSSQHNNSRLKKGAPEACLVKALFTAASENQDITHFSHQEQLLQNIFYLFWAKNHQLHQNEALEKFKESLNLHFKSSGYETIQIFAISRFNYDATFESSVSESSPLTLHQLSRGQRLIYFSLLWTYSIETRYKTTNLLIMDEPDSGLDPKSTYHFLENIKSLISKCSIQIIFTTHNPTTISLIDEANIWHITTVEGCRQIVPVMSKMEAIKLISGSLVYVNEPFAMVFVEGKDKDREFYQRVVELLKPKISYHFISKAVVHRW